jgi:hypothetical protein
MASHPAGKHGRGASFIELRKSRCSTLIAIH